MNRSNLRHPTLLRKIKAAIVEATRQAGYQRCCLGHVVVRNKHGLPVLHVFAERGKGFTVDTHNGQNVTEIVKEALREYHAALPSASRPYAGLILIRNVRCSFPSLRPKPCHPSKLAMWPCPGVSL